MCSFLSDSSQPLCLLNSLIIMNDSINNTPLVIKITFPISVFVKKKKHAMKKKLDSKNKGITKQFIN